MVSVCECLCVCVLLVGEAGGLKPGPQLCSALGFETRPSSLLSVGVRYPALHSVKRQGLKPGPLLC